MAEARGAGWARPVWAMGGVCKGSCRVAALSGRGGRGRGSSFYSAGAGRVQWQKPLRPAPSRRCCVFPTPDWASGAMLYLILRGCRWLGRSFTCLSAYRGATGVSREGWSTRNCPDCALHFAPQVVISKRKGFNGSQIGPEYPKGGVERSILRVGTAWSMVHLQEEKPLQKPSVHICVANTLGDPRHWGSAFQVGVYGVAAW